MIYLPLSFLVKAPTMVRDPALVLSGSNVSRHIVNVGTTSCSLGVLDYRHPVLVPYCCYT